MFRDTTMRCLLLVLSGGLVAASNLACHSSSSPTPTGTSTAGPSPTVSFSPASLSFTAPGTQAVTLSNTGTAVLTITSIAAGGNFTQTNNCPASVAVGASCTINVTFALLVGSPGGSSGSIVVTDNAGDSPESLTLSGPSVAFAVGVLSPATVTFASQAVGTTSSTQIVTLTNPGNGFSAALAIASIATTGDFAVAQNMCPGSLASGSSCSIGVTFTPTSSGPRSGALNVFDNAVPSIQTTLLTGTGTGQ